MAKAKQIADPSYWYTEDDICELLEKELGDTATLIAQTPFGNQPLLDANLDAAMREVLRTGKPAVMPVHLHGNHWAAAVIKRKANGNIQVIYNDSTGNSVQNEPNASHFVQTITRLNPTADIVDLEVWQQSNHDDCGPFTVDNLVRLAVADTSALSLAGPIGQLLDCPPGGNAREIRKGHSKIIGQVEVKYSWKIMSGVFTASIMPGVSILAGFTLFPLSLLGFCIGAAMGWRSSIDDNVFKKVFKVAGGALLGTIALPFVLPYINLVGGLSVLAGGFGGAYMTWKTLSKYKETTAKKVFKTIGGALLGAAAGAVPIAGVSALLVSATMGGIKGGIDASEDKKRGEFGKMGKIKRLGYTALSLIPFWGIIASTKLLERESQKFQAAHPAVPSPPRAQAAFSRHSRRGATSPRRTTSPAARRSPAHPRAAAALVTTTTAAREKELRRAERRAGEGPAKVGP
jgi:hypothetical protein